MPDRRPLRHRLVLAMGALAAIALGCMYVAPPGNVRALVDIGFGVVSVLLLRQAFVSGAMNNPFGPDRDFSAAPALKDLFIAGALALAAIAWAMGSTLAVRRRFLPDTELSAYAVGLLPILMLVGGLTFFLGRAAFRVVFGMRRTVH